ncbi:MAG: winged helix-turn-helix domain-containing protein [Candidatus Peribacteria bacterium]|nr:winged helix-turn-helix domain-containing protein [Candidatus Peribacteria bacterium]
MQILFSNPYITTGELSKDLKTSLRSVQRYVQTLETLGVIQTQSVGRNTLISIPQFIELLK